MPEEKKEVAYLIDFGDRGLHDVRKCVTFVLGIGLLDHAGVAQHRPDIYGSETGGGGKYPRPSGQYARFELLALAEYFSNLGCLVTEVTEEDASNFRKGLKAGKLPPQKYLKPTLEPVAESGGEGAAGVASGAEAPAKTTDAGPVSEADLEKAEVPEPPKSKGKGRGGK